MSEPLESADNGKVSTNEPNWPACIKPGVTIYWSQYDRSYRIKWEDEVSDMATAWCSMDFDSFCEFFDHDWNIPYEPEPLKRKWRKRT